MTNYSDRIIQDQATDATTSQTTELRFVDGLARPKALGLAFSELLAELPVQHQEELQGIAES